MTCDFHPKFATSPLICFLFRLCVPTFCHGMILAAATFSVGSAYSEESELLSGGAKNLILIHLAKLQELGPWTVTHPKTNLKITPK